MAGEAQRLANPVAANHNLSSQNPLLNKQAIIVLREELDYFAITPPKTGFPAKEDVPATGPVLADVSKVKVKTECGIHLLEQRKIFTALQRNINKENNVAEQHLIDMLCVSGFSRDDEWGYRDIEPKKTSIVSIALVMLKTTGSGNQMATAQKLLLFWRKPAVSGPIYYSPTYRLLFVMLSRKRGATISDAIENKKRGGRPTDHQQGWWAV